MGDGGSVLSLVEEALASRPWRLEYLCYYLLPPRVHVSKKLESDLEADPHGGHHTLCIFGEVSLLALSSIVHSWLHRSHPHETD